MDSKSSVSKGLKFGAFIPPYHGLAEDPMLCLRRDIQLAEFMDGLGYDEIWVGEHHSSGIEITSSPELLLAAMAEKTSRIRLGTGVNSLSYHNPLILADRIAQLDLISGGRAMMGAGPGQLASDALAMGISPLEQRRMMVESLEVIVDLLAGKEVTRKTDWFDLREARLQLLPVQQDFEIFVASAVTPSGSNLAGKLGLGLLSIAGASIAGFDALKNQWQVCQDAADEAGKTVSRDNWRVVNSIHVAETREQALKELEWGVMNIVHFYRQVLGDHPSGKYLWDITGPEDAVKVWTTKGLHVAGVAVAGTPDDAYEQVCRIDQQTGGFGSLLLYPMNGANFAKTCNSLEMFARYVRPRVRQSNRNREASLNWINQNAEELLEAVMGGMKRSTDEFAAKKK